jgi:alanine racemase
MDSIVIDVTKAKVAVGDDCEIIGPGHTPDDMARKVGTIGYEVLTALGRRYKRVYKGG